MKNKKSERSCERCKRLKIALNCDICLKYQEGISPMPKKLHDEIQKRDDTNNNKAFNWLS